MAGSPLEGVTEGDVVRGAGQFAVENGRLITPDTVIENGYLVIEGDRIASVGSGPAPTDGPALDLSGRIVVPGLIDLHGDDIDRHCAPRPEASVELETALVTCERENVAAGITTKYHALSFEDAPEDGHSPEQAAAVADVLGSVDETLLDHRVHARCEVGNERCVGFVLDLLDSDTPDMVSIMHHAPGTGQFDDRSAFDRRYAGENAVASRETSEATLESGVEQVIEHAHTAGVPVASHDDDDPTAVERRAELGVDLFEYPVTMAAAARATDLGVPTAMGAPNLLRGGSLWGNLAAPAAVEAGVVDVLCSDYHPHALLESIFVDTGEPLTDRVARATSAPADVAGLDDRGRLVAGNRADLAVIDPGTRYTVRRVFVAGQETFRARPIRRD